MKSRDYLRYAYDMDGNIKGVILSGMGMTFMVGLRDSEKFNHRDGYTTPTKAQATLMCTVMDDLNRMLEEAGGKRIAGPHWTCDDCCEDHCWAFDGDYGVLEARNTTEKLPVRLIRTLIIHQYL